MNARRIDTETCPPLHLELGERPVFCFVPADAAGDSGVMVSALRRAGTAEYYCVIERSSSLYDQMQLDDQFRFSGFRAEAIPSIHGACTIRVCGSDDIASEVGLTANQGAERQVFAQIYVESFGRDEQTLARGEGTVPRT